MAKKKSKKTSKEKPSKKPAISPKSTNTGNFQTVLSALSTYIKSSGKKLEHRGTYAKKAAEIYNAIKDKPQWEENLDVIIPQYLEDVITNDTEKELSDFKLFIENNGFESFVWHQSHTDFDQIMTSGFWKPNYVLRIIDRVGNYKDCREFAQYDRTVWSAIKHDYKLDKFVADSYKPLFEFDDVFLLKDDIIVVQYKVDGWDFVGYDVTITDVADLDRARDKATEQADLEKKKPKEQKEREFNAEIEKYRIEAERQRKQSGFEKEMDLLQKDYEAGRIKTRAELNEEKNVIRKLYGFI